MLYHLISSQAPSKIGIIGLALFPTVIGLALFVWLCKAEASSWLFRLRWLAVAPIVVGLVMGVQKVFLANDFLYRAYHLLGQKMILMHYAVLVVPLIGLIAFGVLGWRSTRSEKYDF